MKIHQGVSSVSVQILSKDFSAQIGFWNNFEQRLYTAHGTAPPARPMSPSSKSTRWSKAKDVTNVFQRWLSMVSGQSKQSCQGIVSSVVYVYERKMFIDKYIYTYIIKGSLVENLPSYGDFKMKKSPEK